MSSTTHSPRAAFENAHFAHKSVQQIPKGAVLLGILKSIEIELRKRNMLGDKESNVTPLWFLAETERNIFLWRQGKSLDDACEYEFWVDVDALVKKRREQLAKPQGLNPFINPLWASAPLDPSLIDNEQRYLEDVEDMSSVFLPHAEALSHASRSVASELAPLAPARCRVVLPSQREALPPAT